MASDQRKVKCGGMNRIHENSREKNHRMSAYDTEPRGFAIECNVAPSVQRYVGRCVKQAGGCFGRAGIAPGGEYGCGKFARPLILTRGRGGYFGNRRYAITEKKKPVMDCSRAVHEALGVEFSGPVKSHLCKSTLA